MKGGNTNFIVVWVDDTAIVKKPLDGKMYYFVADAVSGKPIAKANVEFFGWKQSPSRPSPSAFEVVTKDFAEFTDADGQIDHRQQQPAAGFPVDRDRPDRAKEGARFAYLGFTHVWYGRAYDAEYNATKAFFISDRPVYRPEQTVKYKFWVRHAKYDQEDTSDFANRNFGVEIYSPKGERILQEEKKADAWGGIEGELKLPAEATLGMYQVNIGEFNAAPAPHRRLAAEGVRRSGDARRLPRPSAAPSPRRPACRSPSTPIRPPSPSTWATGNWSALRRRQLPRRGVQEARVRGDGRRARKSR